VMVIATTVSVLLHCFPMSACGRTSSRATVATTRCFSIPPGPCRSSVVSCSSR
jgi:hypothetical protein